MKKVLKVKIVTMNMKASMIYISQKKKKLSDKKEMFALNEIAAEHAINNTCFFNSSVSDNDYFGAIILHFLKLTHLKFLVLFSFFSSKLDVKINES